MDCEDHFADALTRHPSILEFGVHRVNIGEGGVKSLCDMLKNNTVLKKLSLFRCNIGSAGVSALAVALKQDTCLKELHTTDMDWDTGTPTEDISEMLKHNKSLTSLKVGTLMLNRTVSVTTCIWEALLLNSTLEEFSWDIGFLNREEMHAMSNAISESGTLKMVEVNIGSRSTWGEGEDPYVRLGLAVRNCKSLEILRLSDPTIEYVPAGFVLMDMSPLMDGLADNTSIKLFSMLGHGKLHAETASSLANMIKKNCTLTSIDIDMMVNRLDPCLIKAALEINETLCSLSIKDVDSDLEGSITKAMKRNMKLVGPGRRLKAVRST